MDKVKLAKRRLTALETFLLKEGDLKMVFKNRKPFRGDIKGMPLYIFLENFLKNYRHRYLTIPNKKGSKLKECDLHRNRSFRDTFLVCHHYFKCSLVDFITALETYGLSGFWCCTTDLWIINPYSGYPNITDKDDKRKELKNMTIETILLAHDAVCDKDTLRDALNYEEEDAYDDDDYEYDDDYEF